MTSVMNTMYREKRYVIYFLLTSIHFNSTSTYLKNNIERWSCCKKMCESYIHLNFDYDLVNKVINGNHHEENKILNRRTVSNKLK
jgi:hypothetical protein